MSNSLPAVRKGLWLGLLHFALKNFSILSKRLLFQTVKDSNHGSCVCVVVIV